MKANTKKDAQARRTYFFVYRGIERSNHALKCELRPFNEELHYLQDLVGGYLEHFIISDHLNDLHIDMWIDEEGKLKTLEPTWALLDQEDQLVDVIYGNCVFSKYNDEGETLGLSMDEVRIVEDFLTNSRMVELVSKSPDDDRHLVLASKGD